MTYDSYFSTYDNVRAPKIKPPDYITDLKATLDNIVATGEINPSLTTDDPLDNSEEEDVDNNYFITNNLPQAEVNDTRLTSQSELKGNNLKEQVINFFMGKGLTRELAGGIYGNFFVESKFNTKALGDSGTAVGIGLWRHSRRKNLESMFGKNSTLLQQLEFTWWELNHTETKALKKLKETTTYQDAAIAFMKFYERPNLKLANALARINHSRV